MGNVVDSRGPVKHRRPLMRRLTLKIGQLVVGHPAWIAVCFAVLTASSLWFARTVRVDFNFRQFFPMNDPDVAVYDAFTAEFGKDDTLLVVALQTDDVFTTARLALLRDLTERAAGIPLVERTVSIATAPRLVGSLGEVAVDPYLPEEIPTDPEALAGLRAAALDDPLVAGTFISKDGTTAALVLEIGDATRAENRGPVLDALKELLAGVPPEAFTYRIGGIPAVRTDYIELITAETIRLWSYTVVIMAFVLFFTFRSGAGVLLPGLMVLIALAFTGALMGFLQRPLTIMGSVMPVVIMITGVADSIHLMARYHEGLRAGLEKSEAIIHAVERLGIACLITSVTTAVGFAALATTNLIMLREYGLFTAFGVLSAYVVTITLLPALLKIFPTPKRLREEKLHGGWLSRRLDAISRLVTGRPGAVLVGVLLATLLCAASIVTIRKEGRLLDDLKEDNPILVTNRLMEDKLGGVLPLEIVFDTGRPDGITDPASLAVVHDISRWLEARPEVAWVFSTADLLREANAIFHDGDEAYLVVPGTSRLAAQLIEAVGASSDETIDTFLEPVRRKIRISARIRDVGSTRATAFFGDLTATIAERCAAAGSPPGCLPITTGTTLIATKVNDYLVEQIFWSFLLAFAAVTVLLGLMFGSWRLALLALPPNVLPLTATLAAMAAFGIDLKPSTAIIFSIAFGIAVDDTIHFFVRFREEREHRDDVARAVRYTLLGAGRAMVFTTVVLALGFLPGLTSELVSNRNFALLAVITILAALVADLLLSPALVVMLQRWSTAETRAGAPGRRVSPED